MEIARSWEDTHREVADLFRYHEERRIEQLRELQKKRIEIEKPYYFLTVNPNEKIKLEEFIKIIKKAMAKKWIDYYVYVLEQRGENELELGKGFHTHIIFNKGIKNNKVVLEMSNTFKKMCDVSNFHFFNLKSIGDEERKRKLEYITGIKADEAKHLKQEMDIIWRKKQKLDKYYTNTKDTVN